MLSKSKNPLLNRKQRRHPDKSMPTLKGGIPWLLFGLLASNGYISINPVYPTPTAPAVTIVDTVRSFISKAKRWAGKLF